MKTKQTETSHRVIFIKWDKGKGDSMQIVESSTKWLSYDQCREWIDSHFFDTAEIIERESGKCVGSFGNGENAINTADNAQNKQQTSREKAQEHFGDRIPVISGKFLLSKPGSTENRGWL